MELLKKLPMPDLMEKNEIIDILLKEEYGYLPENPISVSAEEQKRDSMFCAGKAVYKRLLLSCKSNFGDFSFPVSFSCPVTDTPVPCFVHINFSDSVPDIYQPTEEIIDAGYAVLSFSYKDVSSDDGDFSNGLAGVVYPGGVKNETQCGKIGLWAWAAMRVMDYAQTLDELDKSKISVIGHSRLGKTALLAGALDERFCCAFSNDSGCSGAALAKEKTGERIEDICRVYPFWFSDNYKKHIGKDDELYFDQHYLLAANYPHRVYVASAAGDPWACPKNEYLSCIAASSYFEKRGKVGFLHPERLPEAGDCFSNGNIGYHIRKGLHYLGREDWQHYIAYMNNIDSCESNDE